MRRLPSLDGLRGLSIALVLLAHLAGTRGFPLSLPMLRAFGDLGNLGVRIFFVISGFLITHLLFEEYQQNGTISLTRFYVRRAFRILPAASSYIAVVSVLWAIGFVALDDGDLGHALTFTMNFHWNRAWPVGHLWSLSVEEQFYLVWPAILAFVGFAYGRWVAVGAIVVAPVCRIACYVFLPAWRPGIGETFPTIMDAIACGCLISLIRPALHRHRWYQVLLSWPTFAAVPMIVVACHLLQPHFRVSYIASEAVLDAALAVMIDRVVSGCSDSLGRLLNSRLFVCLGTVSYSLYLWQQVFLNRASSSPLAQFPQNLFLALTIASLSFLIIERPMLRLRARLERKHSSHSFTPALGHSDAARLIVVDAR